MAAAMGQAQGAATQAGVAAAAAVPMMLPAAAAETAAAWRQQQPLCWLELWPPEVVAALAASTHSGKLL